MHHSFVALELTNVKEQALKLEWCQLSEVIMRLEVLAECCTFPSFNEYNHVLKVIDLLDEVKWEMVQDNYDLERHQTGQMINSVFPQDVENS